MIRFCLSVLFAFISMGAYSATFYAVNTGDWSTASNWSATRGGAPGATVPGTGDVVYTDGYQITVSSNTSVLNLFVQKATTNSLTINAGVTLTIEGYLSGHNVGSDVASAPSVDVVNMTGTSTIDFTASSGFAIYVWGNNTTLTNVQFNPGAGNSVRLVRGFRFDNGTVDILSGTVTTTSTIVTIEGGSSATINIASSAELNIKSPISGGSISTSLSSLIVSGTLHTTNYVNATNVTLASGATFESHFDGAGQTEGWWHSTTSPTTTTLNSNSTFIYAAATDQSVSDLAYGNIIFRGANTTKTLSGTSSFSCNDVTTESLVTFTASANGANISISGDLANNGTFTTSQQVTFNGGSTQTISGNTVTFDGDVVFQQTIDCNAKFILNAGSSINDNDNNVSWGDDITINGTYSAGTGTVEFDDTSIQNIFGSGVITIQDMLITNTSLVRNRNTGGVNLTGYLTIAANGAFDADGLGGGVFTIVSNASNTGGINEIPATGSFEGDVNVQRYFANSSQDWRYISHMIEGKRLNEWADDFAITGNFTDRNTTNPNILYDNASSVYQWDYTNQIWDDLNPGGTLTKPMSNVVLIPARGYSAWMYHTTARTLTLSGEIIQGNTLVGTSNNGGEYSLIGNPYPSTINWPAARTTNGGIGTAYLRTGNGSWDSHNGTTGTGVFTSGNIGMGQSFFIGSYTSSTFQFSESDKVDNTSQTFIRTELTSPEDILRIKLEGNSQSDEAIVLFRTNSTDFIDPKYDGLKRKNGSYRNNIGMYDFINVSTFNPEAEDNFDYVFNSIRLDKVKEIGLNISDVPQGSYTFTFSEFNSFTDNLYVTLIDGYTSDSILLTDNDTYAFSVSDDIESSGNNRFVLHISRIDAITSIKEDLSDTDFTLYPNPVVDELNINFNRISSPEINLQLIDNIGRIIYNSKHIVENKFVKLRTDAIQSGSYILRIQTGDKIFTKRFIKE